MTSVQRVQLELSTCRQRLNELLGIETRSDEQQREMEKLTGEATKLEPELRAALAAEPDTETRALGAADDAETSELRSLRGRAELRNALATIADGNSLDGAEKELAEARGSTVGNMVPWDLFDPGEQRQADEVRADTISAGHAEIGVTPRAIIQRVFARSAAMSLGVSMESVPAGKVNYPIITAGASAAYVAAESAKSAETFTIAPVELEPRRLQARYSIRREDLFRIPGYEPALRADLSGNMAEKNDQQVIAGSGTSPALEGFLATQHATLSNNKGLPHLAAAGAELNYAHGLVELMRPIDGRYAHAEADLAIVVGPATLRKMGTVVNTGSGVTLSAYYKAACRRFMSSAHVPAAASNVQQGIAARLGHNTMAAACPIWEGVTIIRDEISGAEEGVLNLTAVAMSNFAILRAAAFSRLSYKLA